MKYCISEEECTKRNISIDAVLYLLSLYCEKPYNRTTFTEICSRGLVEYEGVDENKNPVNIRLKQDGVDFVEDILLDSELDKKERDTTNYEKIASELILLFPKGKKEGTTYMWRDSKALIARRLKAVVKKYGVKFTEKEAIEATRRYVNSFNGDYRYMQLLKYFIMKKNSMTGEENSQFLSYLENKESDETNFDWTSEIR